MGAVPGGKVWAWNSGLASLPCSLPGLCWWVLGQQDIQDISDYLPIYVLQAQKE